MNIFKILSEALWLHYFEVYRDALDCDACIILSALKRYVCMHDI